MNIDEVNTTIIQNVDKEETQNSIEIIPGSNFHWGFVPPKDDKDEKDKKDSKDKKDKKETKVEPLENKDKPRLIKDGPLLIKEPEAINDQE